MSVPIYNQDKSSKVDQWSVEGSDDEKYDPFKSGKGIWEPTAEDILKLFEKLEKEKVLELKWKCPGRRPPGSENEVMEKDVEMEEKEMEISIEEEKKPEQPTEFDFDDDEFGGVSNPITPRRTPGAKTPKSQKKVATMDKVLKNIMIERKQVALQKEQRKLSRSPRTPQSAPRPKIGTPPVTSVGQNIGQKMGTPVRPQTEAPPVKNLMVSSASEVKQNITSETKDAYAFSPEQKDNDESKSKDKGSTN